MSAPRQAPGGGIGPVLRTEMLTVRFGGLTALNQVNFEVARGEIRAIIGPNGAGKSTFFNCLTGVLRPTSGRICFNGEDITGLPPDRISQKGIARSYQITNILPNATRAGERAHRRAVAPARLEHAAPLIGASATSSKRPRRALDAVGLLAKADELAANLSHGEQRNLEIGIALATEPQLLCLDEPTAGMSAAETHDTMQLVRRIAKDLTILIVEHDMQVVMELADRITVLHYGAILAEGRRPRSRTIRGCRRSISRHEHARTIARSGAGAAGQGRGPAHLLRQEPHPARRFARRSGAARWSACSAATASARAPP